MFKWLFIYWKSSADSTAVNFKINVWAYINARLFKIKISNILFFFIMTLNSLSIKSLKIFYKSLNFELIYFKLIYIYLFFIFIFLFL